jgi:acetyl-CoA synthetase
MGSHNATLFPVTDASRAHTLQTKEQYLEQYARSIAEPEAFWRDMANQSLQWHKPFTQVKDVSFAQDNLHINWFADGELNVSVNCIDRHLQHNADKTAIIFEGDSPDDSSHISYQQLHDQVCQIANALRARGVNKGDRVSLYMPNVPQAIMAMLACARIGAIHSVVFGGFSPDALAGRVEDCGSVAIITADIGKRGGKAIPLKANVDEALTRQGTDSVHTVLVLQVGEGSSAMKEGRDFWFGEIVSSQKTHCQPQWMNAEDPLFILYTSGSTGKPKGVLHSTAGYLLYTHATFKYVFDYQEGEVFWCTADVGWITGHSYMAYGPLSNGATQVVFEGVPTYPGINRFAQVVEKHKVNILYTAPTAIRSLMQQGDAAVEGCDLSSLRLLGSVGEPINPEAWHWYHQKFGRGETPIVDTWWQTETGGVLIAPLPGATDLKPGSATLPFFGIQPALVDNDGGVLEGEAEGNLVILDSWPGQMRTVYGDHERFVQTYFSTFSGVYTTGDGARRDKDGYYWITGRVDDVLNVSGHRMGTAEIESALVAHPAVAEAAVAGVPHDIKGEGIYCYVSLQSGSEGSDELVSELRGWVRKEIGPIASPDYIQWAPGLPKTRSGKIMRRILRKIAANDFDNLGDTSTLADPSVLDDLIHNRLNR